MLVINLYFAKIKRGYYYDNPNSIYPTTGDFVVIEWNKSGDSMIYETLKRNYTAIYWNV